MQKKLIASIN